MKWLIPIALATFAAPAAVLPAQPAAQSETTALRRANELAAAMAAEDGAALRAMLGSAFVDPNSFEPQFIAATRYRERRIRDVRVSDSGPNRATIAYRGELSGRPGALAIEVEPSAPFRIAAVVPQPAPDQPVNVPAAEADRLREIDAFAQRLAQADIFSGVVLIARDGEPIYQRAFGLADRTFAVANRIDTKFNLGSMNKMFTAIAIGQLVEAGRLSLDDPLSRFMPDFPDAESAGRIRIKHLLTHTSGLGNYFNEEFLRSAPGRFRDVASYLEVARTNARMEFEPGSRWSYSNTGMLVLGRIVEIVSGMDYYDYIQRNIYDRAGMRDSGSFDTDAIVPNRATGYEMQFTAAGQELRSGVLRTPARGAPAGGGYATAPDLLRLANAIQAGRLLRPETLALFTAAHPELNSPNYGYGFSRALRGPAGRDIVGHGGDFSDGTCANLAMIRDADRPYTAIVLSNGTVVGSCHALTRMINAMFPARTAG